VADPNFDVASASRNKLRVKAAGDFDNNAFDGNIHQNISAARFTQNGVSIPSFVSGFIQIREQEVTGHRSDGFQIQGFIASGSNFIVSYNVDR